MGKMVIVCCSSPSDKKWYEFWKPSTTITEASVTEKEANAYMGIMSPYLRYWIKDD